jgi:hypothetical protein
MSILADEFGQFPRERELIGDMLMAYGELEFVLIGFIGEALNLDLNTATRILFRVRGETARLSVADAILRPIFSKHELEAKWINAFCAADHCKNIRNQYAHCHWQLSHGKLHFIDMDEDSRSTDETLSVTLRPIDLPLIERQHLYFQYALFCLYFLHDRLM